MAQVVVIDTDIGTDIDDTWALAFALRCPELDVRLITTSTGDPLDRAALVADLLAAGGRREVPIGVGLTGGGDLDQPLHGGAGHETLEGHPGGVHDGVSAMVETIESATSEVTVIALGPLTTVAAALERRPAIAHRARLVGMQGSLRVGYRGEPGPVPSTTWRPTTSPSSTSRRPPLDRRRRDHAPFAGRREPSPRHQVEGPAGLPRPPGRSPARCRGMSSGDGVPLADTTVTESVTTVPLLL